MVKYSSYLAGIAVMLFTACSPRSLDPKAYSEWVKDGDNGLRVSKEIMDYRYELQHRPAELVVLQELNGNVTDKSAFTNRVKEMEDLQYYNLHLFGPNGKAVISQSAGEQYFQRLEYYTSIAQQDISLTQDGDTLPCVLYHFERYYDLSPYNTLVLGFPKSENPSAERTLVFNDRALSMGPVKFNISASDFNNIPSLQIP